MKKIKPSEQMFLDRGYKKVDDELYQHTHNKQDSFRIRKVCGHWRLFDESTYGMDEEDLELFRQILKEFREEEANTAVI